MTAAPDRSDDPVDGHGVAEEARRRAAHRRARDRVFGDVLDGATLDDRPDPAAAEDDRWLRENVPPHHGT